MGLKESSYFVPGFRRYLSARKRIGGIFFRMHVENVPQVQDLTALSKVFNTDPDTIKKHGFFRVYEGTGKAKTIVLHDSDKRVISIAENTAAMVNSMNDNERRMFQMVLSHLSEKDGDII